MTANEKEARNMLLIATGIVALLGFIFWMTGQVP
jgi:hypothetical protein